ncbi:MAG: Jag N-terminal domain-containing protein [Peptoniphilaceae bacterium]|nr:Jag N-terminal domain-containing protein [Peptoniphilaceae bacterium]MDY5766203.1 RNA-binding cell elongation regulator Jag/EloR [Peptoniphilaceae bacterium]
MRSVVKTGKSVDDAVTAALEELNASLDDVNIEIMEQPKSGFFGMFGTKDAVVRVSLKKNEFDEILKEEFRQSKDTTSIFVEKTSETASKHKKDTENLEKKTKRSEKKASKASKEQKGAKFPKESPEKKIEAKTGIKTFETPVEQKSDSTAATSAKNSISEKAVKTTEERKISEPKQDLKQSEKEQLQSVSSPKPKQETFKTISELIAESTQSVSDSEKSVGRKQEDSSPSIDTSDSSQTAAREEVKITENTQVSRSNEDEQSQFVKNWVIDTLRYMHIEAQVETSYVDGNLLVEILGLSDSDMGIVIGRRAETLNALQYLLGIAASRALKKNDHIYLDVGGYRERRNDNLRRLAHRNVERVLKDHRPVTMEPMNAYERRIVHTELQDIEHISTVSEGREPHRRVIIRYEK